MCFELFLFEIATVHFNSTWSVEVALIAIKNIHWMLCLFPREISVALRMLTSCSLEVSICWLTERGLQELPTLWLKAGRVSFTDRNIGPIGTYISASGNKSLSDKGHIVNMYPLACLVPGKSGQEGRTHTAELETHPHPLLCSLWFVFWKIVMEIWKSQQTFPNWYSSPLLLSFCPSRRKKCFLVLQKLYTSLCRRQMPGGIKCNPFCS